MKKLIKSRIFLVIITTIIVASVSVYAATTYKATDVVYNASDGTSMNVSEALNELYNNNTDNLTLIGTYTGSNTIDFSQYEGYKNFLIGKNIFFEITNIDISSNSASVWANNAGGVTGRLNAMTKSFTSLGSYDNTTGILTFSGTLNSTTSLQSYVPGTSYAIQTATQTITLKLTINIYLKK